jgi:hypothetical protein
MKRTPLLLLLLLAFTFVVSSCNNDDDPPPPAVVGVWEFDRLEISDLPAAYAQLNGAGYDNYLSFGLTSRIDIQNDKSFDEIYKSNGIVLDLDGNWEFNASSNILNLNYTDTDIDDVALTYDPTKKRLYGEKFPFQDSLRSSGSTQAQLVRFNLQPVYVRR